MGWLEDMTDICSNCSAELRGRWCYACGQDSRSPFIGFFSLIGRTVSEFFSLDAKLPRSVATSVIPGRLPRRYLQGHRVSYITPVRFAVSASILLFTVIALLPGSIEPPSVETGVASDVRYIAREGAGIVSLGLVLIPPIFAGLMAIVFIDKKRHFVEYLTIALYYHATLCLTLGVVSLIVSTNFREVAVAISLLLIVWMLGPYIVLMLRRCLNISWLRLALTAPLLSVFYAVAVIAVFGASAGYLSRVAALN